MKTSYIVLRKDIEGRWAEYAYNIEAASTRGAVRAAAGTAGKASDGEFVAVPTRSWQPLTVKVEMQERLTIS